MELAELQQLVTVLDGLRPGEWLRHRLDTFSKPADTPSVLVLISSPRTIKRAFPEGLTLNHEWIQLAGSESEEETVLAVENSDLVIWGMSALRLFPGDYAAVLETARGEKIPIWAIVTGLGHLSDRQAFIEKTLPESKARLPAGSEIILYQANTINPIEKVEELLAQKGQILAKAGRDRRKTNMVSRLRVILLDEREDTLTNLTRANQQLDTAKSGIRAIEVMVSVMVSKIFGDINNIQVQLNKLQKELKQGVTDNHEELDIAALRKEFKTKIAEFCSQNLEKEINRQIHLAQEETSQWCWETSQEMESSFRPYLNTRVDDGSLTRMMHFDPTDMLPKVTLFLEELRDDVLNEVNSFTIQFDEDIIPQILTLVGAAADIGKEIGTVVGDPQTAAVSKAIKSISKAAKEAHKQSMISQALELLASGMRTLEDTITYIIKTHKSGLGPFFVEAIRERGDVCLRLVTHTVSEPQEKMKKIVEAENLIMI